MQTKEGAAKAVITKLAKDPNIFSRMGAKGGKAKKGIKHTEETKRKISETKKRRARENHQASN